MATGGAGAPAEVVPFRAMADDGNDKKSGTLADLVKAESMVQLALVLPMACVIGGVGGAALDKHFHTNWIAVTGILLGAAAGFIQIYKVASRQMKRDR
jgi:ATP synthase protein I